MNVLSIVSFHKNVVSVVYHSLYKKLWSENGHTWLASKSWKLLDYFFIHHVTKMSAKYKLKMDFSRDEVLDLLFEEENGEALDKIFDSFFVEAVVGVNRSLFCIKPIKRDICKCNFELLKSYS